jgi:hypothetical protein
MRRLSTIFCCAAAAVAVAAPASAGAKAKQPSDQAVFSATLSGSQVTIWETHDPRDPNDPCDGGFHNYGDQSIKFAIPGKFKQTAYDVSSDPDVFGSHGRPTLTTAPTLKYANATATRNTDEKYEPPVRNDCGENGGGVVPDTRPKDCGTRTGSFLPKLFYDSTTEDDDLFVPLPGTWPDKDFLKLGGQIYQWNSPKGGTESNLGSTFENCNWTLGDAWQEREGQIFISQQKLKEANLFNPRKRSFVVSGSSIVNRSGPKTTGKTIVAWNLRLKRLK